MPLEMTNLTSVGSGGSTLARGVKSAASGATGATSFGDSLGRLIDNVEDTAAKANDAVTDMMDKTGDVHEAMIALQRAEMTLQLTVQIRNKLVQAYHEVMRMPI